jgi:DUF4097 and DUF4098 domain-containing protein YvlB
MRDGKFAVLATAVLLCAACDKRGDQALESIVEKDYDFPPGGELTVRNAEGSIRIYGSAFPGMKLIALKKAYSLERLNKIEVKISPDAGSRMIDTVFPPKNEGWGLGDRSGTVDYVIVVPDSARIGNLEVVNGEISVDDLRDGSAKARLVNGRMFSHNCFGDLDFAVTTGRLDFFYDWWEPRTFVVEGAVVNGNINAYMPHGSLFHADAETPNGRILDHFGETETQRKDVIRLKTTIGSGPSPSFRLRATHGNIHFEKAY